MKIGGLAGVLVAVLVVPQASVAGGEAVGGLFDQMAGTQVVGFDSGEARIPDRGYRAVLEVARLMAQWPETVVVVEGHAGRHEVGPRSVAEARALRVVEALVDQGVERHRLVARSLGSGAPVAVDGSGLNRAVRFVVREVGEALASPADKADRVRELDRCPELAEDGACFGTWCLDGCPEPNWQRRAVFFEPGEVELTVEGRLALARMLREAPADKVWRLQGHAGWQEIGCRGKALERASNLGRIRAAKVARFLLIRGVSRASIRIESAGMQRPRTALRDGCVETAEPPPRDNRRVEVL